VARKEEAASGRYGFLGNGYVIDQAYIYNKIQVWIFTDEL
jgi:hypothetical protein